MIKFFIIKEKDYQLEQREKSRQVYRKLMSIVHQNIIKIREVSQVDLSNQNYNALYQLLNKEENKHLIKEGASIPFVVMDYISGDNIKQKNDIDFIDLLGQIFSVLLIFEQYSIIHGDLHLQNIMYDGTKYIVIDFDNS